MKRTGSQETAVALRDWTMSDSDDSEGELFEKLECEWPNVDLDEDIFGLSICSFVRDFYLLAQKKGAPLNRYSRILSSFTLLIVCWTIQMFLLAQVKRFVSAKAVHDVRIAYDIFEQHMYDGHTKILFTEPTLERRGLGHEYFNASRFDSMSDEDQTNACRIPLSQPWFFWVVLYIWSLVCVAELRKTRDLFLSLVWNTGACLDMKHALEDEDGELGGPFVVTQLTKNVKALITVCVLLPRFGMTCYLLWLGCRWLLATNNFADLILNSVALEFILCLKDVLFIAMVPRRSMLDLGDTKIKPALLKEPESMAAFVGTILWGLLAAAWVTFYMGIRGTNGIQRVLRDYQWDVHEVCIEWVLKRYDV